MHDWEALLGQRKSQKGPSRKIGFRRKRNEMGRLATSAWFILLAMVSACCVVTARGSVYPAPEDQPRRRKLLLHVGPHKTGTTAFQSWLRINEGISPSLQYPKVCGTVMHPGWYSHLASALCGKMVQKSIKDYTPGIQEAWTACPPTPETLIAALNDVESNPTDLVISSETFTKCSIDQFGTVKALFGHSVDIELVILRRESKSLMLSRYHQWHKFSDTSQSVTDTFMHGDDKAFVCSYTSLECLRGLSEMFGAEHVHVFSYEGLLAAGKELAEALCDVFSNSAGCYAAPSKDSSRYKPNESQPHEVYSAATILNHFKTITGCRYPGEGTFALGRKVMPKFMEALEKAGVRKFCYPLSHIPSVECDSCFFDAVLGSDETISKMNHYYFHEGAAYVAASTHEVCEYKESSIYESAEKFAAVAKVTKKLADSCTKYRDVLIHTQL